MSAVRSPGSDDHQLGNVLPNGEDYRPQDVHEMMERLWAKRSRIPMRELIKRQ
jgi:hypothetical protein